MKKRYLIRTIQIAIIAITATAVIQELSRPREQRRWHGKVLGFIPYDFRLPTWERIKESWWNPYERHILTPRVFGVGWAINLYSLFENLDWIHQSENSEEDFLIPNKRMKQILRQQI